MRIIPNQTVMLPSSASSTSDPSPSSITTTDLPVTTRRWRRLRGGKDQSNTNHTSGGTAGPRNRLRRYIVVSSTVLLIAYSTLVVKVPFVNGRARPGRSSSGGSTIFASADIFRLAQRPWGSIYRRKRHRRPTIDSIKNHDERDNSSGSVDAKTYRTIYNLTIKNVENSLEHGLSSKILYHHQYSKYRSKVTKAPFIRQKHLGRASSELQMTKGGNCISGPSMVVGAFINDWACIPRGGDVAEKPEVISSPTISASALLDPVSVIIDDPISEVESDELKVTNSEKYDSVDDTENDSTIVSDYTHQSSLTSLESAGSVTDEISYSDDSEASATSTNKYVFSFYQKGDGSEDDVDKIPIRYLKMQNDNRDRAKHAVKETLKWRELNNIDNIIGIPHPDYDVCKASFPHFFLGFDNTDTTVVFIQRPALLNMELAKKNQLTNQALLNHYVYVNEYLWRIVEAERPLAKMTSVIDLYGLNLSILRQSDIVSFLKIFVQTMDSHFPQRASRTLLINAPKWFHMLYKLLSPLLRESTKEKIKIYSNSVEQDNALLEVIHSDNIDATPKTFWSSSKNDKSKNIRTEDETTVEDKETMSVSQLEHDLRVFTLDRLDEAGIEMQKVVF